MAIQSKFIPRGRNVMTIRVTSYDRSCLKGRLSSALLGGETEFDNTIDLLLQMQQMMDETNLPQRNEEARSFGTERAVAIGRQPTTEKAQTIAVFQIQVMFRQNATWQGNMLWVEANEEAHFRSVLELLLLLNSALTLEAGTGETP